MRWRRRHDPESGISPEAQPEPTRSTAGTTQRELLDALLEPDEQITHGSTVRASFVDAERGPQVFVGEAGLTERALVLALQPADAVTTWYGPAEGRIPLGIIVGEPTTSGARLELEYRRPNLEPGSRQLTLIGLDDNLSRTLLDRITDVRVRRDRELENVRSRLEPHLPPGQQLADAVMVRMSPPVRGSVPSGDYADGFIALTHDLVAYGHLSDPLAVEVHPRADVGCWSSPQDRVMRLITPSHEGEMTRRVQPRDPADEALLQDICDQLAADS